MYDLTGQQIGLRLVALLLLIPLQGGAIAAVAWLLGDKGPRHDGRVTLNPLAHLDWLGLAGGLLFAIGWSKPVAVEGRALRGGCAALLLPVLAGCAAILLLIALLAPLRLLLLPHLSDSPAQTLFAVVETTSRLGTVLALAGLLPLPPFGASVLIGGWRPALAPRLRQLQVPAGLLVLLLAGLGWLDPLFAWLS